MANRRLQYRQVFWRNGWSTASERAQASSDWTAPRRPWHNNGDRLGLSELGAVTRVRLYPRALTPRLSPLHATRPQCNLASPEVVPYSLRSGTRADDDPSSRRSRTQRPSRSQVAAHPCGTARSATALRKRPLLPETWVVRNIGELAVMRRPKASAAFRQWLRRCKAERRIRARPSVNAHPDVVRARESAASRLAWRNNHHRPSPRSPRAPDEPSAALGLSLDATPFPVRRRRPHRPAQPGRSVSRGVPRPGMTNTDVGLGTHPGDRTRICSALSSASSEHGPKRPAFRNDHFFVLPDTRSGVLRWRSA